MGHFAANVDWLRERGEVALFDFPGFGNSPAPLGPLSLDFFSDVAAAYAKRIGWTEPIDVIGQSHGGAVAQTLAVREPSLVRSIVLLGTMGYPAHLSMRLAMIPGIRAVTFGVARRGHRIPFSALTRTIVRAGVWTSFAPDAVPHGLVEREWARTLATPSIAESTVRANEGNPSQQLATQAHRLRAPVLLLHGRDDRLVPIAYARRLFQRIGPRHSKSQMVELDGGHMLHLTRPTSVHAELDRWFEALSSS